MHFLPQIEGALEQAKRLQHKAGGDRFCKGTSREEINASITSMRAVIERAAPKSTYQVRADATISSGGAEGYLVAPLVGILEALKQDFTNGWTKGIAEIVAADIYSDYIDMALDLLQMKHKDAAAVIAGSTLESHLRKLCDGNGIPLEIANAKGESRPKKSDVLNSELASSSVYNKLEQKQVTAWLDLRNKAAHGHYGEYGIEQVQQMVIGVRDFIARN